VSHDKVFARSYAAELGQPIVTDKLTKWFGKGQAKTTTVEGVTFVTPVQRGDLPRHHLF
jgi:hypothetical protein